VVQRRGVGEGHSSRHYQPEKTGEERRGQEKTGEERREREAGGGKTSQGDRNQRERR
jgi:hypothetical protein